MFSIMINGSLQGFFPAQRLREGHPLSPFLFVSVREALSTMIGVTENAGLMAGFKVAALATSISHLQYADNTLIFCEAEDDQVRNIKAISRLKINFYKSKLISLRVDERHLHQFAKTLRCKVGSFTAFYLGLPLYLMVEKVEKRLSTWATRYLSLGGRITLIRSTLSNISIYFLSIFNVQLPL